MRKQVDDAHAETKAVRQDAEQDASQRDIESSQLRQLIMELKDELQQAVRVRAGNKPLPWPPSLCQHYGTSESLQDVSLVGCEG